MTIGIYCLRFNGTDKVYIGQSVNIEKRYQNHLYNLKNNITSHKLIEAYKNHGIPTLVILTSSTIEELDALEQEAITLYNAIDNGFNTSTEGSQPPRMYGEDQGSAKYSNKQIEKVFHLLVNNPNMVAESISKLTEVSISTIRKISGKSGHLWLKDKYPEEYKQLESINRRNNSAEAARNSRITREVLPLIKSPNGDTYSVTCFREFAREHNLDRKCLAKVLRGNQKCHKGWVLWVQLEQVL